MTDLLTVTRLDLAYGQILAVKGAELTVNRGEVVVIVGANGAGKTTLLRGLSGLLPSRNGDVLFKGHSIARLRPHALAKQGMLHIPEGRGVLASLSVIENLRISYDIRPTTIPFAIALDVAFARFPRLRERQEQRAGDMSGGEQQMLALARVLVNPPDLLLLDEPSLGLSPIMVKEAYRALEGFKGSEMAILLVEQNARLALKFADRAIVMRQGRFVASGTSGEMAADERLLNHYLGGEHANAAAS